MEIEWVYSAVRSASLNKIHVYIAVRRATLDMNELTMYCNGQSRLVTSTSREPRVGAGFTPNPTACCYKVTFKAITHFFSTRYFVLIQIPPTLLQFHYNNLLSRINSYIIVQAAVPSITSFV
jgi:hypothetical protein